MHEKLSYADGVALVQSWLASAQRPSVFCRERDVALHALKYWRGRLPRSATQTGGVSLLPICVAPVKPSHDRVGAEVGMVSFMRAADGALRLCVNGDFDVATCRAALELLL